MKVLIVISSKSPNPYLYNCIEMLYKIQIDSLHFYKICVIDSDSDDLSEYNKISDDFPYVEINFIKNKHYEYGAWKYSQIQYPDYDIYFCLQDTMFLTNKIDLSVINDTTVFTWHNHSGYFSDITLKHEGILYLKDTNLYYNYLIDTYFNLAYGNIFIVNNNIIKDIFNTFNIPSINKEGSRIYERNFGLYFIIKNINTIDLSSYLIKYHGNRN